MSYAVATAVIFGVNLLPAFGPPTWSVIVLFKLHSHVDPIALVGLGAAAAALGRYALALASRRMRGHLSAKGTANLAAGRELLTANRTRSFVGLGLFALSPIPSAQLFEAAGLMDIRLGPVVVAFFAGRLVSYSIYLAGASALTHTSLGGIISSSLTNPVAVVIQLVMLAGVVALTRVDWAGLLRRRHLDVRQ